MKRLIIMMSLTMLLSAAAAETVVVVGGTVHTMGSAGTLQDATIIIEDGQIAAIRQGRIIPDGAVVIEADGKVITPGLFAAQSALGLVEVGAVAGTVDGGQRGDQFGAAFDVADAFNPDSSLIPINRAGGVTRAVITPYPAWPSDGMPGGGVISGLAAVIHLGDDQDALVMRKAALVAHIGERGGELAGGSRSAALQHLTTALDEAIEYGRNRQAYDVGASRDYAISRPDLLALQSVVSGDTPVFLSANRA
ncbi:MAG: imidazolonepropionase, partial [Pseudomonadota bacterium]